MQAMFHVKQKFFYLCGNVSRETIKNNMKKHIKNALKIMSTSKINMYFNVCINLIL